MTSDKHGDDGAETSSSASSQQDEFKPSSEAERKEYAHRVWLGVAKSLVAILEGDETADKVQAAHISVARQWLADNGVRSDNLDNPPGEVDVATEELARQVRELSLPEDHHDDPENWPSRLEQHHDEGNL